MNSIWADNHDSDDLLFDFPSVEFATCVNTLPALQVLPSLTYSAAKEVEVIK